MATLREWLTKAEFDWDAGTIIYQQLSADDEGLPVSSYPGWCDDVLPGLEIAISHPVLDLEFDAGFGGPECPRIFARDAQAVYFPSQYDGATELNKIHISPRYYTRPGNLTPYPGG